MITSTPPFALKLVQSTHICKFISSVNISLINFWIFELLRYAVVKSAVDNLALELPVLNKIYFYNQFLFPPN